MSQKTHNDDGTETIDSSQFKTTSGVEGRNIDVSSEEHPMSGMDTKRDISMDSVGENFIYRYDDNSAFIREYLANAHTACIQACRYMIRDNDDEEDVDMNNIREVIEFAQNNYNYEPIIEVRYSKNPESNTFVIEDNGIGIPTKKLPAVRDVGLSSWGDDGASNGKFGQGTLSGFIPVSVHGEFYMSTYSRESEEKYSSIWEYKDQRPVDLKDEKDTYGTKFVWPYFTEKVDNINVKESVSKYTEGMIIPVIYEEYNEEGRETGNGDEYTESFMEEKYDDSVIMKYEDRFGKIIFDPTSSLNGQTYCGYQPIERNDRSGYTQNKHNLPRKFDIRIKNEKGAIVEVDGSMDHELVGNVPVHRLKYENLPENRRDIYIPKDEIPDDKEIVRTPKPTDDRDRLESKYVEEYMERYTEKAVEVYMEKVSQMLDEMDSIEDILNFSKEAGDILYNGLKTIGILELNTDEIRDKLEKKFNLNISNRFLNQISYLNYPVKHIYRHSEIKGSKPNKTVFHVIQKARGDDIYIGQRISRWKAEVAWDLKENNQVVKVSTDEYGILQELFDWKLIKDEIPRKSKVHEEFEDQLSDDVVGVYIPKKQSTNKLDGTKSKSSKNEESDLSKMDFNGERAKKRTIKVRDGAGNSANIVKEKAVNVFDAMDGDGNGGVRMSIQGCSIEVERLVAYKNTEHNLDVGEDVVVTGSNIDNTYYTVIPEYVYDYLIQAENVYTEEEFKNEIENTTIVADETIGDVDEEISLSEISKNDIILSIRDSHFKAMKKHDVLKHIVNEETDDNVDPERIFCSKHLGIDENIMKDNIIIDNGGATKVHMRSYSKVKRLMWNAIFDDLDRRAPEMRYIDLDIEDESCIEMLKKVENAGGFVSNDDEYKIFDNKHENPGYTKPKIETEKKQYVLSMQRAKIGIQTK